jgi:HAD superfamily, subfamily IIIB (Acid phosphatase)
MTTFARLVGCAVVLATLILPTVSSRARDIGQGWSCGNPNNQRLPAGEPSNAPPNIGQLKNWLREYRYCGKYEEDFARVLSNATQYVLDHAADAKNPAIVLDIDETSISNWVEIEQDDFAFVPAGTCQLLPGQACGDFEWELSSRAEALQPTLSLFNMAKKQGTAIFFITGRYNRPELRDATVRNLKAVGYDGWEPAHHALSWLSFGKGLQEEI